jgi:hypothetical protein
LNVLTDNRTFALLTFRGSPFCSFGLAIETPGIAVFFDVSHALLERVTAFCAEEMTVVPVGPQSNGMFSDNWSFAMLAERCKVFVPVKMAVETEPLVSIFSHCLAFDFLELLTMSAASNAIKPLSTFVFGLRTDLQGFETGAASITDKAMRMKTLGKTF